MFVVPAATPVTKPDATVAMPAPAVLHVPPVDVLASEVVVPGHVLAMPDIAAGTANTVTARVARHVPKV
jgi:hypothetical protein